MNGPLDLVHDMIGPASDENGYGLCLLAASDEGHLVVADLSSFNCSSISEIILCELVQCGNDPGSCGFDEFFHIALLCPSNGHDAGLRKVVLDIVIDTLLADDHGRTTLQDLVSHSLHHAFLFVKECLELGGVGDLNLGIHLGLFDLQCGIDQGDLCLFQFPWHTWVDRLLINDDPFDDCGITNRSTVLLLHFDVIDVCNEGSVLLLGYCSDSLNGDAGKVFLRPAYTLAGHCGHGDIIEDVLVLRRHRDGNVLEYLKSLFGCHLVTIRNDGWMHTLIDEVLGLLEQLTGNDNR